MRRVLAAMLLVAGVAARVDAQQVDDRERSRADPEWRYPIMLFEAGAVLVPPAIYYWNTVEDQKEDWELRWDWESWHSKLLSTDGIVLDTNRFMPNAVRHPLTGAYTYEIGRANGFSPWASLALDFAHAVLWEYVVEYREKVSANDIFTNTFGGLVIGEPLFQLGGIGDGDASPAREALSWVASPFHRAQSAAGLSWLRRHPRPEAELSASLAPSIARFDARSTRPELAFGLDLAVTRDGASGKPGVGSTDTGLAGWNHELLDLRFGQATDASGVTGARFRSETTYFARYDRDFDDLGDGDARRFAIGGGMDLSERRLDGLWDRVAVFELAGPSLVGTHKVPGLALTGELAAYGDVAMVQAHVFPHMQDLGKSVLLWRGYYYATGATFAARVRADSKWWLASADATAHQFWSFDAHDHGGDMDPKGVSDQRVIGTARLGIKPTAGDLVLDVFGDAIVRRGSWNDMSKTDAELAAGVGVSVGF